MRSVAAASSAVAAIVGAAAGVGRGRPADSVYNVIIYRTASARVAARGVGEWV